jgi:curved DNA-binding protein CbpA
MKVGYYEAQHDFYAILGVDGSASGATIRKAYLRLVWELHPDRPSRAADGESRMKVVNLAATVLLNPAARARYDELRREAKSGRLRSPTSVPPPPSSPRRPRPPAYRARHRAAQSRGPGPLADDFFRRLVRVALIATFLIAYVSEHTKAHAPRRTSRTAPIVYAPDYPPYPVRYALTED